MKPEEPQFVIDEILRGTSKDATRPTNLRETLDRVYGASEIGGIQIRAGDWQLLRQICKKIDDEIDGSLAWAMARNVWEYCRINSLDEMKTVHEAISKNVERSTVLYVDRQERAGKKWNIASGTLVEIDGKVFVATTEHSIPPRATERLMFVPHHFVREGDKSIPIVDVKWFTEYDVAYIEVDSAAPQLLGKNPIGLNRIDPCGSGRPDHRILMCGYPQRLALDVNVVNMFVNDKSPGRVLSTMTWWSERIPAEDWQLLKLPKDAPGPDQQRDVFLPWPEGSGEVCAAGPRLLDQLGSPAGMSGGGYWHLSPGDAAGVWNPERYGLMAIQSVWDEAGEYVRATQISHWLRLLWQHQETLRTTLSNAFPDCSFG